ncbi:lytic murein transglycosylase B [Variovorax sp. SG517]|uniref:lytic murein transglycosylase B n=1 Tax=unclassified Variovorax TaxID=663243 RepID=UPI00159E1FB8|nr:lytic murein transglycosylase B [Variovorax sp. SG517]NVM92404.1 membrane-bound lytic murein transglycosylase B [Variovorax sp. SG517]
MRFLLPKPSRTATAAAALLAACSLAWSTGALAQKSPNGRSAAASPVRGSTSYATRDDAMQFADDVAERRGLDREWVRATIGSARFLPNVPRLMLPGPVGTVKNWQTYRGRFIDPVRIAAGVRFWRANADTLARAEQVYGVPPEIIVGIIGVETIYGRNMGNFRVIDALATLSFDFPDAHPRAADRRAFFRGELESFLSTESRTAEDPLVPLGSYAGAMGMPQFMPSSIAKYAVDFDGDSRIDLVNNPADVIGSVANYFKSFGWQPGVPAIYPVHFEEARLQKAMLLAPDILPTFSADSFVAAGAVPEGDGINHKGLFALVELQNGLDMPPTYVAGTRNFYVITRYNWSSYYAMSVLDLGQEVKAAMEQQQQAAK